MFSTPRTQPTAFEKLKKMWEEAEFIRLPRLPILEWLPKYQVKQQLTSDLNAGLACAVLLIPQVRSSWSGWMTGWIEMRGRDCRHLNIHTLINCSKSMHQNQGLAYGIQIGVPVIHGLYGAIFFGLVYAVWEECAPISL